jgi:Flp pilus assembly protein TadG
MFEKNLSFLKSRGQSLTELALLLPLLVLILLGTVDLARVYNSYVTLTNAAREGARYGATHPLNPSGATNTDAIRTRVIQEAANSGVALSSENITVECISAAVDAHSGSSTDCASPSVQLGDPIRVRVAYDFSFVTTYLFGIGTMSISNYAEMPIFAGK